MAVVAETARFSYEGVRLTNLFEELKAIAFKAVAKVYAKRAKAMTETQETLINDWISASDEDKPELLQQLKAIADSTEGVLFVANPVVGEPRFQGIRSYQPDTLVHRVEAGVEEMKTKALTDGLSSAISHFLSKDFSA